MQPNRGVCICFLAKCLRRNFKGKKKKYELLTKMENVISKGLDWSFLRSADAVSEHIKQMDWSGHALGMAEDWSFNFKQMLSLVLHSHQASFLLWGASAHSFYNFSFSKVQPVGKLGGIAETSLPGLWPSLAAPCHQLLSGQISSVIVSGFELSAVQDEDGHVVGIMGRAMASSPSADLADRLDVLSPLIEHTLSAMALLSGSSLTIAAINAEMLRMFAQDESIKGQPLTALLPGQLQAEFVAMVGQVYRSGEGCCAKNTEFNVVVDGIKRKRFFSYSFSALYNAAGEIYGVLWLADDVTEVVYDYRKIEQRERDFQALIMESPVAGCLMLGPDQIVKLANSSMLGIWNTTKEEAYGKPLRQIMPETMDAILTAEVHSVYSTGNTFTDDERKVKTRVNGEMSIGYVNIVCQPFKNYYGDIIGVLAICVDVTAQVVARRKLESLYEQNELAKKSAQLGTFDFDILNRTLEVDNRFKKLHNIPFNAVGEYTQYYIDSIFEEDVERVRNVIFGYIIKGEGVGEIDEQYRVKDGNAVRWIRAKGKIYENDLHQRTRFIGTVIDTTNQKTAELQAIEISDKTSRLASIVDTTDDIIISIDTLGIIKTWNKAAERMFGYAAEEVIGLSLDIIIPEDRDEEAKYIQRMVNDGGGVDHFDTVRVSKDGTLLNLSITVSPIKDDKGVVTGASKIARDISATLNAQAAILKYTSHLETVNEVTKSISEKLDLEVILQKVTDATTQLTGAKFGAFFYHKRDSVGNVYKLYALSGVPKAHFEHLGMPRETTLFHPTFQGVSVIRIADVTSDNRYGTQGPHHGMPNGHLAVRSYLAVPVVSYSGEVIGSLLYGHPQPNMFTEEHEGLVVAIAAQAAIGVDNAMLYEKTLHLNDRKDEFIGLASHELKTPLASVSGYLQLLSRQTTDVISQQFLRKALLQVNRLVSLVNDLLDVSKIEAGKLKFNASAFDMETLTRDAIELVRNTNPSHRILLRVAPGDYTFEADGQRIEQVIVNLLSNAIKYSPKADEVSVEISASATEVKFTVTDSGIGIPADKINHLFSRFYRVDDASSNISGLGIGLYLCQEIVRRHHGKIWVLSELGDGSTFYFTLPKQQPSEPDAQYR